MVTLTSTGTCTHNHVHVLVYYKRRVTCTASEKCLPLRVRPRVCPVPVLRF